MIAWFFEDIVQFRLRLDNINVDVIKENRVQKINEYLSDRRKNRIDSLLNRKMLSENADEIKGLLMEKMSILDEELDSANIRDSARIRLEIGIIGRVISRIDEVGTLGAGITDINLTEENESTATLVLNELAPEMEVTYLTDGPTKTEESISDGKRVTISSDIHYDNILAYTDIPDSKQGSISVFWIVNYSRIAVQNVSYFDLNNDTEIR